VARKSGRMEHELSQGGILDILAPNWGNPTFEPPWQDPIPTTLERLAKSPKGFPISSLPTGTIGNCSILRITEIKFTSQILAENITYWFPDTDSRNKSRRIEISLGRGGFLYLAPIMAGKYYRFCYGKRPSL